MQALLEVESNADIRASLREVWFTGAKEIDAAGKKAICIQVPVPQQKTFQKIQVSQQSYRHGEYDCVRVMVFHSQD